MRNVECGVVLSIQRSTDAWPAQSNLVQKISPALRPGRRKEGGKVYGYYTTHEPGTFQHYGELLIPGRQHFSNFFRNFSIY